MMHRLILTSFLLCSSMVYLVAQELLPTKSDSIPSQENPRLIDLDSLVNDGFRTPAPFSPDINQPNVNIRVTDEDNRPAMYQRVDRPRDHYQTLPHEGHVKVKVKSRRSDDIKTLSGISRHRGAFGALAFRSTTFREESLVMAGVRGGWIISRALAMGFEGHGIIPTARFTDIPNVNNSRVATVGGYGGFFLEPIFFSNEVIHFTIPVTAGAGWMGFIEDWEDNLLRPSNAGNGGMIDEDIFWYLEPGITLELNVAKNFRINMGVSKRFTQDLKLVNTDLTALDTYSFILGLKIGRF